MAHGPNLASACVSPALKVVLKFLIGWKINQKKRNISWPMKFI
jgi:hypothetical protein